MGLGKQSLTCDRCLSGKHRCQKNRRCACRNCAGPTEPARQANGVWQAGKPINNNNNN